MRKYAFTLAEILIVLAIIGVVAALTVPDLIQNTQGREYKTQLKKGISVLNQAVLRDIALNNTNHFSQNVIYRIAHDNLRNYEDVTIKTACGENSTGVLTADGMFINIATSILGLRVLCTTSDCVCSEFIRYCLDVNGESGPNVKTTDPDNPQDGYNLMFCIDDNSFKCADAACKKVFKE